MHDVHGSMSKLCASYFVVLVVSFGLTFAGGGLNQKSSLSFVQC